MSTEILNPVLVVDDDPTVRDFLRRGLSSRYRVFTADGVKAAEPILAREEIKVIICDDQMPGETGLAYLSRIRDQLPHTRRILLTGNNQQAALVFAINQVHVFHYLIKPVPIEDLRALVQEGVTQYDLSVSSEAAAEEGVRLRTTVAKHLQAARPTLPPGGHERMTWLRLVSWGSSAAAVLFALGVCTLVVLYFLKSWLGIDFFENHHLKDFFW